MLEIVIPGTDGWDDEKEMFVELEPPIKIKLEHSLLSLAKWEEKWHKPLLSNLKNLSSDEILDYYRCMTIGSKDLSIDVYKRMTKQNVSDITAYINDPFTATTIHELRMQKRSRPSRRSNQTAETIYASMFELNIPLEFEKRHLNHLLTLIRVCQERMNPGKPMSKAETLAWQREQNELRKARMHSRG